MTGIELGTIPWVGEEATARVTGMLEDVALHVYRSFDLRSAGTDSGSYGCPYHNTEACDCQMVVLLVYGGQNAPATVILHGHQGRTWMVLTEAPDPQLEAAITAALAPALRHPVAISSTSEKRRGAYGEG